MVNEGKVCFRGNIYMESVSSSPQSEKANAGSHRKVTKKSQVSQGTAQKKLEGRRSFYARPYKRGSGWLMMRKIEQLLTIVFVLLSAEFDFEWQPFCDGVGQGIELV